MLVSILNKFVTDSIPVKALYLAWATFHMHLTG